MLAAARRIPEADVSIRAGRFQGDVPLGFELAGDPLLPAIALVNALRKSGGVRAGQIITTGTCTGMPFGKPGDHVTVSFTDFGTAEIDLPA